MKYLAYGIQPGGPRHKLCGEDTLLRPSEEPNEAKQAYPRRDSRQRLRWKDGSHLAVENTHANESRCDEIALESNLQTEPLVTVPPLLKRNCENKVSTRDRLARAGADARTKESAANAELRLVIRPYGRKKRGISATTPGTEIAVRGQ